jgi:hypothetical protein
MIVAPAFGRETFGQLLLRLALPQLGTIDQH